MSLILKLELSNCGHFERNNLEKWIKDLVGSAWFLRTKHRVHQLEQGTNSSSTTPSTLKQ
jgi:hypothetical protein